jgi:tRNA(Ile2) C34 agmatinyltransferase TiaS
VRRRILMRLILNRSVTAYYLEEETVCPLCATDEESAGDSADEDLMLEELEGHIDELRCDRCGARVFSSDSELAARSRDVYDLVPDVHE